MANSKNITLEGRVFSSKVEACKYYNLNVHTVYDRLRNNWSLEEAFEVVPREARVVVVNGVKYSNLAEASKRIRGKL